MNLRTFPVLLALPLLALASLHEAAAAPADQAAAIRAARLAQNAAIVRRDLDAIASFWTDNVTICRGLGVQVAGKAAYLALFRDDDPANAIIYERLPDDITVSAQWPLAFETGRWAGRRNGKPVLGGRYSAQWVRDGDRWLIRGEVYVALEAHDDEGRQMKSAPAH
jgi:ketosteroid isomerase-like protein